MFGLAQPPRSGDAACYYQSAGECLSRNPFIMSPKRPMTIGQAGGNLRHLATRDLLKIAKSLTRIFQLHIRFTDIKENAYIIWRVFDRFFIPDECFLIVLTKIECIAQRKHG